MRQSVSRFAGKLVEPRKGGVAVWRAEHLAPVDQFTNDRSDDGRTPSGVERFARYGNADDGPDITEPMNGLNVNTVVL